MPANRASLIRPNGLHFLAEATLTQLAEDTTLSDFAGGLVSQALSHLPPSQARRWTLAKALHYPGPEARPLLTALLVLDAEVAAVVAGESRVFPLPGFLTYRERLPLAEFPLNTLRLRPLNPDGQYQLTLASDGSCYALRLDLHPRLKVAGHVRLAVSSPTRPPVRLRAVEHRLERQKLTPALIEEAVQSGAEALAPEQQRRLAALLEAII
jgi:CO/xanthine dehydrogenase FAD-binding subunit